MKVQHNTLDLANLISKITGHPMCFMLEETDYTFAALFNKRKNGIIGVKVSRGLGDGKALEKLLEKLNCYT